eukprot:TRINITY_DN4214_c0_g1_i1.p1 TRINITY_DN4214_c0_g1~~TRINITY_DN4214_c0_g1_i1.p1  ORF type:complete len:578 (+),score=97.43 TRINITY_DN4214_c0_g1_i1:61-1794(+)
MVVADVISKTLDYMISMSEVTKVAFITYDTKVHLYTFKIKCNLPTMMVLHDLEKPVVPQGHSFLCNLKDCKGEVSNFLSVLPKMFETTKHSHACLGTAAVVAREIMKAFGGKMVIFSNCAPSLGLGICPSGYDSKYLGTPSEMDILVPSVDFYKNLAVDCINNHISVELFSCSSSYHNLPSLSILPHCTGGQIHHYPHFSLRNDATTFGSDIQVFLATSRGWEASMRVRGSKGIVPQQFLGNLFTKKELIDFPVLDSNKAFGVRLKITEPLQVAKSGGFAYLQGGIIYTTETLERRIRVMTVKLSVAQDIVRIFRSADPLAIVTLMAKVAVHHALKTQLMESREVLVNQLISIMTTYSKLTGAGNSNSLLPDSLQSLPLYILSLVKSAALRSTFNVQPDERTASIDYVRVVPVELCSLYLYPRLYPLHNMPEECGIVHGEGPVILPPLENLSMTKLSGGAYLLDNGIFLLLWISSKAPANLLLEIFGFPHLESIDVSQVTISYTETLPPESLYNRIAVVIATIVQSRQVYQPLLVSKEGDVLHSTLLLPSLVEDRQVTVHSYFEFLQSLSRSVRESN